MRQGPARAARRLVSALRRDRSGAALVELAVAAPLLLLLYCAAYTYSDAIACNRKVVRTARSLADMVSRYPAVTAADLQSVLNSNSAVMAPYSNASAWLRVSEVQVTDATHGKVIWSRAKNGVALTTNATVALPANLAPALMQPDATTGRAGSYFLIGEAGYRYTALFGTRIMPASNLYGKVYMLPRLADQVPLS